MAETLTAAQEQALLSSPVRQPATLALPEDTEMEDLPSGREQASDNVNGPSGSALSDEQNKKKRKAESSSERDRRKRNERREKRRLEEEEARKQREKDEKRTMERNYEKYRTKR